MEVFIYTIQAFLWMDELFHNRSVAFISLDPYGMLGVTVIFSSGQIDGAWIIISVFLRGIKQQLALVKIVSLQYLLLSVTVNEQITQTVFPSSVEKQEQMKKELSQCLQDTER